jgi:hypothetical protein
VFWPLNKFELNQITSPLGRFKKVQFVWRLFAFSSLLGLLIAELIEFEIRIKVSALNLYKAFTIWSLTLTILSFAMMLPYTFFSRKNRNWFYQFSWKI